MLFGVCLFLAWVKCGRDLLPARSLFSTVPYIVGKLPIYARIDCFQWNHEMGKNRPQQTGLKNLPFY